MNPKDLLIYLAVALATTVIATHAFADEFSDEALMAGPSERNYQQETIDAIESVPLQNAWWGVIIQNGNSMGQSYTPTMSQTHF
jgi:hypothetical protein